MTIDFKEDVRMGQALGLFMRMERFWFKLAVISPPFALLATDRIDRDLLSRGCAFYVLVQILLSKVLG